MTKYTINPDTKEKLISFLEQSVSANNILEKEELDTDDINTVLAVLGKFPASMVYSLIEDLKISLNPVNNGSGE